MEAVVSLGSSVPAGPPLSRPRKHTGFVFSLDISSARKSSPAFIVCAKLCLEHQPRLTVSGGAKGTKNFNFEKRASMPIFSKSGAAVATEHPKLAGHSICTKDNRYFHHICRCQHTDEETAEGEGAEDLGETWGVKIAIAVLKFYKSFGFATLVVTALTVLDTGEISTLLPGSCRFVPTCSEYSMQAYRIYGVAKGTILTAWRLARCNPFGGSGFDPPRWFGEDRPIL